MSSNITTVKELFADRANGYEKESRWTRDPRLLEPVIELVSPRAGMRVLDVGAGTGALLDAILDVCPSVGCCVALDISKEMLGCIGNPRVERVVGDAQNLQFPACSFDVVVCRQSLHYMERLQCVFEGLRRVLDAHGALVIAQITPSNERDEAYWNHVTRLRQPLRRHFFTVDDLVQLCNSSGFRLTEIRRVVETESVDSWVDRCRIPDKERHKIKALLATAPRTFKEIHRFSEEDGTLCLDKSWVVLRALRSEAKEPDGAAGEGGPG